MMFLRFQLQRLLLVNNHMAVVISLFRLPDTVSRMAKLDFGLKPITIRLLHRSPQNEFSNGIRREKKDDCFRYALTSWSRFMKFAGIQVGDTVYYSFDEIDQVLSVGLVVPHMRHTD
ncbi:hypothetical protein HanPI659440_Chr15g0602461 [Helianthus annuus]|nr:hypothetical protein HanPI659440_Chr15g0602461 [Helianthus annuus]